MLIPRAKERQLKRSIFKERPTPKQQGVKNLYIDPIQTTEMKKIKSKK